MSENLNKIKGVSNMVKQLLINEPDTRNSDNLLYRRVIETIATERGIDANRIPVTAFFSYGASEGFPSLETVSRTRRKLQATYRELDGSEVVVYTRAMLEDDFKLYAVGGC